MAAGLASVTLLLSLSPWQIARADSHQFQCPARIEVDGLQLSLAGLNVFDGPIENRIALVPETTPGQNNEMRWSLMSGTTPYMKCRYRDSRHYLVLVAENATRCIAKLTDAQIFEASCS